MDLPSFWRIMTAIDEERELTAAEHAALAGFPLEEALDSSALELHHAVADTLAMLLARESDYIE